MQSNQIIIINGTLRVIGAFLLLSRRAHLLTTHKMGGGTAKADVRSPRVAAPSEPCGSCRRAVTFRAIVCSLTALSTLYHSLDSVGIAAAIPNFFFIKRTKTIWKGLIKCYGNLSFRSKSNRAQLRQKRRCRVCLYELLQDFERLYGLMLATFCKNPSLFI